MKVKELINILERYNQELTVVTHDLSEGVSELTSIQVELATKTPTPDYMVQEYLITPEGEETVLLLI
jgi:hypothetical protein